MKPDKKLVSTITNRIMKKEKKITIKFFLRKDYGNGNPEGTELYYPLYIDFIHRRKKNRCRSLFEKFHCISPVPHVKYNKKGVSSNEFNEMVEGIINEDVRLMRTYKLDFIDLLMCEKQHAINLFKLFKDISDEDFFLSNLSEGYQYSLKRRAYDLCGEVMKELVLDEFIKLVPTFPIRLLEIIIASYTYYDFSELMVTLFNLTEDEFKAEISGEGLINLGSSLTDIEKRISEYITIEPNSLLTLTIPTWVIEGHQNKLEAFLLDESRNIDVSIASTLLEKLETKIAEEVKYIKHFFIESDERNTEREEDND